MAKDHPASQNGYIGRESLSTRAYRSLYANIISLKYAPGQYLEEASLVEELSIGRTPVREALQRLEADLLLVSQPGKGFLVRPLTLQNTKAAFHALSVLELGIAPLAVRHRTTDLLDAMEEANKKLAAAATDMDIYGLVEANGWFHDAYAHCSDNIYLIQGIRKVRCEINRLAYLSYGSEIDPGAKLSEHYATIMDHHHQVIDATRSRNEALLKEVIQNHIDLFKDRIIHYLAEI